MDTFFKAKAKEGRLTFDYVFDKIRSMAKLHGTKANLTKEGYLEELLFCGEPNETKVVIRFIQRNFKMGAAEMFMQSSLARAFLIEKEWGPKHNKKGNSVFVAGDHTENLQHWEKSLQKVINQYPFHTKVIESLQLVDSIDDLKETCHLVPGIPCKPQLAKPTKDISIIFKRFENMPFTCEFKYDGLRGQIHFKDGKCDIFSRNLENMTEAYPDIIESLTSAIDTKQIDSMIVDSEIVGFCNKTGRILPFQTLMTRNKKNVTTSNIEIQVCIYIFDILYLNGESLL